jgi:hypothetical protein
MSEFDEEVMWAVSGTGDDFQCVHVDFAREQQAEIKRLRSSLQEASLDLTVLIEAAKSVDNAKLAESVSKFRAKIDAALSRT